ncbi:MAG: response regulator transcription factor [Cyanobacteriota bacterium]
MNRIAIISTNEKLKETFKEYLSVQNYLIIFSTIDEINESIASLIIIDLSTITEARNKNIKKEYFLKTVPVLASINNETLTKFYVGCNADDFILENASKEELITRVKFLMAKVYGITSSETVEIQGLIIDLAEHKVLINFKPIDLTYMEFKLLQFFATNPNRVFSRNHILERVWGYDYYGGTRTVDVHVRRLRSKLGYKYEQFIQTVRNVGYKFSE